MRHFYTAGTCFRGGHFYTAGTWFRGVHFYTAGTWFRGAPVKDQMIKTDSTLCHSELLREEMATLARGLSRHPSD